MGGEQVPTSVLIAELRFVSQDRSELALELIADIDDKGGANVVVEGRVNNFKGAMRCELLDRIGSGRALTDGGVLRAEFQLFQPCQKASFVAQHRSGVVIGMPPFPIGQDDDARPRLAKDAGNFQSIMPRVLDATVGDVKGAAPSYLENFRGLRGFVGALFRGAASS